MSAAGYPEAMAAFAAVAERRFTGREIEYLPAIAPDGEAAMPGDEPWRYYGTERSAGPGWGNRVTRLSLRELLTFDAASAADFLAPVHDHVGLRFAHHPPQGVGLQRVGHHGPSADAAQLVALGFRAGHPDHLVPIGDQHRYKLPAERTRGAGAGHLHGDSIPRSARPP